MEGELFSFSLLLCTFITLHQQSRASLHEFHKHIKKPVCTYMLHILQTEIQVGLYVFQYHNSGLEAVRYCLLCVKNCLKKLYQLLVFSHSPYSHSSAMIVIKRKHEVGVIYPERFLQVHLYWTVTSSILFSPSNSRLNHIVYPIKKDYSVLTLTLVQPLNHWQVMSTVITSLPLGSLGTEGWPVDSSSL